MNNEQMNVAKECAELSAAGKIHFGEVVGRLIKAGIERYHADYSRGENTYYTPDGGSCVVPMAHESMPIGQAFSAAGVEAAVRQAQRRRDHVSGIYAPECWPPDASATLCKSPESACNISDATARFTPSGSRAQDLMPPSTAALRFNPFVTTRPQRASARGKRPAGIREGA